MRGEGYGGRKWKRGVECGRMRGECMKDGICDEREEVGMQHWRSR